MGFRHVWTPELPTTENRLGAVLDLTELYKEDLDSCARAVWLQGNDLHVVDLIQAGDSACTVRWAMCTEAETVTVQPDGVTIDLGSGWHKRVLTAEVMDGEAYTFPWFITPGWIRPGTEELPSPVAKTWPVTYDPARPELEGMEHLHPTDAPNPGAGLAGYTFTLQPHRKVALHVRLERII